MDENHVDLRIATGPHVSAAYPVLSLTPERVDVRVPAGLGRLWPESRVEVRLGDPLTREGLLVPGVVAASDPRRAEVHFLEPWAGGAARAERRTGIRVQPGRGGGVEVCLAGPAPIPVELVDLGPRGLCVVQPDVIVAEGLEVQLLLPGRSWPLLLAARRTHVRRCGEQRLRCGYTFVPERTADAEVQLGSLAGWVEHFAQALAGSLLGLGPG